jgi:hypothetical protein
VYHGLPALLLIYAQSVGMASALEQSDEETEPVQTLEELQNTRQAELKRLQVLCSCKEPTTNEPIDKYEDSYMHERLKKINSKIRDMELEAGTDNNSAMVDYRRREEEENELIHYHDNPYLDNPYRLSRDTDSEDSEEDGATPADAIKDALDQLTKEAARAEKKCAEEIEQRQEAEKVAKHHALVLQQREQERRTKEKESRKRIDDNNLKRREQQDELARKREREAQYLQNLEARPRKRITEPLSPKAWKRHQKAHEQAGLSGYRRLGQCEICLQQTAATTTTAHKSYEKVPPPALTSSQQQAVRRGLCGKCGGMLDDCLCDTE